MTTLGKYNRIVVKYQLTFEVHVPKHIHTHTLLHIPIIFGAIPSLRRGLRGFPQNSIYHLKRCYSIQMSKYKLGERCLQQTHDGTM